MRGSSVRATPRFRRAAVVYAFEVTRRSQVGGLSQLPRLKASRRLNPRARRPITTLMSRTMRLQLVFLLAALAIGGAVGWTATAQRATATARAPRLADAHQLEDTTLYQELEAGLSNEAPALRLEEFLAKEAEYGVVLDRARKDAGGDRTVLGALARADLFHQRWLALARRAFSAGTPNVA